MRIVYQFQGNFPERDISHSKSGLEGMNSRTGHILCLQKFRDTEPKNYSKPEAQIAIQGSWGGIVVKSPPSNAPFH